jgi:septal ring factor EnvC (AmiA/AmiB activator)
MAQRRTRSVRWVLVISCMIAVHSSQISNIILGRKRSKRPAHPAINFHIQPSQQRSDQESKIADVESAIEQVNLELDSTESKIEQVESDIEQVNEQLKTATGADRDFLRKKELSLRDEKQSLRDEKQSLRDEKQSLRGKEQSLREGLLLLMKDDQRDASADTSLEGSRRPQKSTKNSTFRRRFFCNCRPS